MITPEQPIRIAFCITDLDAGGAERALVQLATRLDRTCWEPHVFCLSGPGPLVQELEQAGIATSCLGAGSAWNVMVVYRLYRALKEFQPALLQTYLFHANIAGRIAGRWAGVKQIVSGIRVAEKRSKWPLRIDRWTDRFVARHVCVSRAVAEFSQVRGKLPTEKIRVIPNGVDAARFAEAAPADLTQFDIPTESQTILFVGRLDPQKAPFVLLQAVAGIVTAHPEVQLLLVGEGPLRSALEDWIRAHDLGSHVHFAGRRDDVPALMKSADCLALPSRWEGMPNVVLEAMAAGLPVVATDVEGTAEVIRNHETGLLVPADSPRELTATLIMLLTDKEQSRNIGIAAQDHVSKEFTWNRTIEEYERLYRGLLEI